MTEPYSGLRVRLRWCLVGRVCRRAVAVEEKLGTVFWRSVSWFLPGDFLIFGLDLAVAGLSHENCSVQSGFVWRRDQGQFLHWWVSEGGNLATGRRCHLGPRI